MKEHINRILNKLFELELVKIYPREAVSYTRNHFKEKEITAIEIGTFEGEHAKSILKKLNIKKIYLIDPYLKYEEYKNDSAYYTLSKAKRKAHRLLRKYEEKIIWKEDFSSKVVSDIKENADFIYVDGNHNYEFVKEDLENYFPLVKEGGILAGHDIQGEGVSKAVLEFVHQNKLILRIGDRRDWWIVK